MKKTLQDQYLLIKEGKGHKDVFIKEAKRQFPGLIRNSATYTEVANVLKSKNLINENVLKKNKGWGFTSNLSFFPFAFNSRQS